MTDLFAELRARAALSPGLKGPPLPRHKAYRLTTGDVVMLDEASFNPSKFAWLGPNAPPTFITEQGA